MADPWSREGDLERNPPGHVSSLAQLATEPAETRFQPVDGYICVENLLTMQRSAYPRLANRAVSSGGPLHAPVAVGAA